MTLFYWQSEEKIDDFIQKKRSQFDIFKTLIYLIVRTIIFQPFYVSKAL